MVREFISKTNENRVIYVVDHLSELPNDKMADAEMVIVSDANENPIVVKNRYGRTTKIW